MVMAVANTTMESPFEGTGRGRGWPLLTGERGHYELVAGNDPTPYLTEILERGFSFRRQVVTLLR